MSINSGKFYDAVKMREFCDGWKDLVLNYAEKKVISDNQFSSMRDTESFRGMTADQSKLLVKKGMGRMLREVAKTQKKMRKAQTEVMELFENMVDPSQNARIEYDTLEMINNDFKELYYIYKDRADNVRRIVDCLNNEFGNYAYFEQPDSQTGLDAFYDFCGGDSDTAGYLRKCQDKLAAFDMQAKALLSGKDTMTKTENLNTHIVNTKIALAPAPTSGVTSCKVTLDPVDNSKATANAKKNTKDDMYSYLQSYYGFTDDEMDYLKANYPNLLTTLYNAQSSSTRLEMRTYEKIKHLLFQYKMDSIQTYGIVGTDRDILADEQQKQNAEYIYWFLRDKGWTKEAICGLLGNIYEESNVNPGVWQDGVNASSGGYGLVQYTDADRKDFYKFMVDKGYIVPDGLNELVRNDPKEAINCQLEYLLQSDGWLYGKEFAQYFNFTGSNYEDEMPEKVRMSFEEFQNSTASPASLALIFHASYERSGDDIAAKDQRGDSANDWYEYFEDYK